MSTTVNSATFTFGYSDTDFTRKYKLEGLEEDALGSIKGNVMDWNASIASGDDTAASEFFVSDDHDNAGKGKFTGITAAQYDVVETTDIPLS